MGWSLRRKSRALQKINGLVEKNQNKLYFLHLIDILNDLWLPDNMLEKLKVDDIKKEIMSELQKSIELFFQNELSVFKKKCEEFETQMQ